MLYWMLLQYMNAIYTNEYMTAHLYLMLKKLCHLKTCRFIIELPPYIVELAKYVVKSYEE